MATQFVKMGKELAEAHKATVAGGQTAAGVAKQLLAEGAVDSEKPEAYEDEELKAPVENASTIGGASTKETPKEKKKEPERCSFILRRGIRQGLKCDRSGNPCYLHKGQVEAQS